ncbi:unnamed protein product, partial [marine sediment metagenome]
MSVKTREARAKLLDKIKRMSECGLDKLNMEADFINQLPEEMSQVKLHSCRCVSAGPDFPSSSWKALSG